MKHRILMIASCLIAGIATLFILHLQTISKGDAVSKEVQKGQEILKAEANKDVVTAEKAIRKVEENLMKEKTEKANKDKLPFRLRYQNTVILGDSMAEAFLDYQLLPRNIVLAIRGRRTDNSNAEITKAIALAPNALFLSFGMNDLPYYRGNAKRFINQYTQIIKQLKTALPDTQIFVNSIVPMAHYAYKQHPIMKHDKQFNQAIKKMCKQLKVTYIDNDALINGHTKDYEMDGIHPKYPFYPAWLKHMAQIADR